LKLVKMLAILWGPFRVGFDQTFSVSS
jgi:hypothetical protein